MAEVGVTQATRFPTHESERARDLGQKLLKVLQRAAEWAAIDGSPGLDPALLRRWRRDLRMLTRSASRPPALGVFGESQVGKSYLISCFSSAGRKDILVRDPQTALGQPIDPKKPWAAEGGIPFLGYINAENKEESTGIICRFTEYPADRPLGSDAFVGRVLSHMDLLLSLAIGYLMEFQTDENSGRVMEKLAKEVTDLTAAPREPASHEELADLEAAWRILRDQHGHRAHVSALSGAGFTELVGQIIATNQRPAGAGWFRLTGLLWNGSDYPALTDLYRKLYNTLKDAGFPTILEIPTRVVCRDDQQNTPITDVRLLDRLFDGDGNAPETVQVRGDEDAGNRSVPLSRPVISALLSELTLPIVSPPSPDPQSLLEVADVLDFPGARAPTQSQMQGGGDVKVARQNASWAFRRGKLTRLFGLLTEEREITGLCLAAGGDANAEAPGVVRQLLGGWLEVQRASHDGDAQAPPLFLAVTKADALLRTMAAISTADSPLGTKLTSIRQRYSVGPKEQNWMDNWARPGNRFQDIHWVYNVHAYALNDTDRLKSRKISLLAHPMVRDYVSEPEEKWEDLIKSGGVTLLTGRIVQRLRATNKFRRLRNEMRQVARDLAGRLRPLHRSGDMVKDQESARQQAARLVAAIRTRYLENQHNVLADLLGVLRIDPDPVTRLLDQLDRNAYKTGPGGRTTLMTFGEFFTALQAFWAKSLDDRFSSERLLDCLGIDSDAVAAARQHWCNLVRQPWMRRALEEVLDPYFEGPIDAHRFSQNMASAACWVWNRRVVELDELVSPGEPVARPPSLSPKGMPPWFWILDHWERRLPDVYAGNVSGAGPVPPGNQLAGEILDDLQPLESKEQEADHALN